MMNQEDFEGRESLDQLTEAIFELTRPDDQAIWRDYYEALSYLITGSPDQMAHVDPFFTPKADGSRRLIFRAERELRIVHSVLAEWLVGNFPMGDDYCYLGGRNPLDAVSQHILARSAVVFDLHNAFESVQEDMVGQQLARYLPAQQHRLIPSLVDLLTLEGSLRQGWVVSPYVYNLVMGPFDAGLTYALEAFGSPVYTRYSDNCCISSAEPIDLSFLSTYINTYVTRFGFQLSWLHTHQDGPITYLGTSIYQGSLALKPEKLETILLRVSEAIESSAPQIYYKTIEGIFVWARRVCGDNIPAELLDLFATYFGKRDVGLPPKNLLAILAKRHMRRLF